MAEPRTAPYHRYGTKAKEIGLMTFAPLLALVRFFSESPGTNIKIRPRRTILIVPSDFQSPGDLGVRKYIICRRHHRHRPLGELTRLERPPWRRLSTAALSPRSC